MYEACIEAMLEISILEKNLSEADKARARATTIDEEESIYESCFIGPNQNSSAERVDTA